MSLSSTDPRTGEPGPAYPEATIEDLHSAVAEAAAAGGDPRLRARDKRSVLLRGVAARLRVARDDIVAVCEPETGLPEGRLRTELERTCAQLEAFAELLDAGDYVEAIIDAASRGDRPPHADIRRMLVPIGPVAVLGPANFPLAFGAAGGDTASALAAGCPVVFKGHPAHPGTSELVAREIVAALGDAGLPNGTFGHLAVANVGIAQALIDAPEIAAIAFTGSHEAGRAILDRAAARPRPIPVYAEMSSINPLVVTPAALRENASGIAEGLVASVATFGGQLCTKPGVVFVPTGDAGEAFIVDVVARLDALAPTVLLGERMRDDLRAAVARLAELPQVEALSTVPPTNGPGFRHRPAAYRAAARDIAVVPELLHEHFGPVVLLIFYASRGELLEALRCIDGQLTGTLHSGIDEPVADVVEVLVERAGRVIFNGFPTGVAVTHGMQHGGPFPATTCSGHTSVGMTSIRRFLRPVAFQDAPRELLPPELQDHNPLGIWRRVDGELTRAPVL